MINILRKVTGYKINTQKSVTFLYDNNKNNIWKTILFTLASKETKQDQISKQKTY